jgi:glycosyltransferase involved in cell wall biosynthesis
VTALAREPAAPEVLARLRGAELVVVMPAHDEQDALPPVLDEWTAALDALGVEARLLVVDDGSTDATPAVLDRRAVADGRVVPWRQDAGGHGRACLAGYRAAAEAGARWVLQVDSDGQCRAADLPAVWARRGAPAVLGVRTGREDGRLRVLGSLLLRTVVAVTGRTAVADPNVPYRLVSGPVLAAAVVDLPEDVVLVNVLLSVVLARVPGCVQVPVGFRRRIGGRPSAGTVRLLGRVVSVGRQLLRHRGWVAGRAAAARAAATPAG